jgi:cytochrome c556
MLRKPAVVLMTFAVPLLLAACQRPVEDTRPGQPVKTRQLAFKEMLKVFEPMGTMLRTNSYEAEKFAALAGELMARREAPWRHFGPDTRYPPTKAKAEVWSEAAQFERERQEFFAASEELLAAAKTKDRAVAEKAYFKAYDRCQSCHDRYKEK